MLPAREGSSGSNHEETRPQPSTRHYHHLQLLLLSLVHSLLIYCNLYILRFKIGRYLYIEVILFSKPLDFILTREITEIIKQALS